MLIEIFELEGDNREFIYRMAFALEDEFHHTLTRIVTRAPTNTLRRDRYRCGMIRTVDRKGREWIYYCDSITSKHLNICEEYNIIFRKANELAQARGWGYAWKYATPKWRHTAILKQMRNARKQLIKQAILPARTLLFTDNGINRI